MSGTRDLQAAIPSSPIVVDAPNGEIRVEWRMFFNRLWMRTGGSQGDVGTGTITGVTAGTGLSGGGTSGAVTLNMQIPVTVGNGGTGATTAAQAVTNLGALPTTGGTLSGPLATQPGSFTAQQIYQMAFPGVVFADVMQGVVSMPAGYGGAQQTAVAGYATSDAPVTAGEPNAVALFGCAVAHSDNANVWGLNTLLTDNSTQVANTNHGRLLSNELDFNVTSPNTVVFGLQLSGASLAQPTSAYAVIINPLGAGFRWSSGLVVADNATSYAITIGYAGATSGANLVSQPLLFFSTDGSGARQSCTITSGTAAPSAVQPSGSLYMRAGGSIGARLYVSAGGGTWNAVAGV